MRMLRKTLEKCERIRGIVAGQLFRFRPGAGGPLGRTAGDATLFGHRSSGGTSRPQTKVRERASSTRLSARPAPPDRPSVRPGLIQNRSIRTKLLFGVVTLSAMSVILGGTGLFGFYRYKSLAAAISTRATELPLATRLSRYASTAESANQRLCRYLSQTHQGMIDSSVLAPSALQLERTLFDQTMVNLSLVADQYGDRIGLLDETALDRSVDGAGGMLIDTEAQRQSLQEIIVTIEEIECLRLDPRSVVTYAGRDQNDLTVPLRHLVVLSQEHLALMHGQMADFSDHVKGQHQAGFAIACVVLTVALATTVMMIWFFRTTVIAPFRTLVDGSRLVAGGQFNHRIDLGTGDELGELAEAMNQMADNFLDAMNKTNQLCDDLDLQVQQRSREVIRNEQLAGVGFLAAGFAHEINNPMATIAWSAEALESRINDLMMVAPAERHLDEEMTATLQENLQRIQSEAFRCKSITEKMLDFSRLGNVERSSTEMGSLVRDVADMVRTVGKYRCKQLQVHCPGAGDVFAYANPSETRQVVLNLITNAMECVSREGRVDVYVEQVDGTAVVRVVDNGCGMSEDVRSHVFEPFYTRRRDGTGTGLGLSISSRIVSQHGGSLDAESKGEGFGSEFILTLPSEPITEDNQNQSHPSTKYKYVSAEAA